MCATNYGCSGLTSATIGNSVTSIGSYAFSGCSTLYEVYNLSSLNIQKGSTNNGYVGYYAKAVHTSLDEPSIWPAVAVGDFTFLNLETPILYKYTGNATDLVLPSDFEGKNYEIGDKVFMNRSEITSVTIPNSVTSIGSEAFSACTGLTSVTIGNSVTSIGGYAFHGCRRLTSIIIPKSVSSIGKYAFYGCSDVSNLIWGSNVTANCITEYCQRSLKNVTLLEGMTSIGNYAFQGCSGLTSITIPNSVTSIGHDAFAVCSGFTSITIPNSVSSIGDGAFAGCSGLTSISIPNSVTSIGSSAFSGCNNLASLSIGSSVRSIGSVAFEKCRILRNVYCFAENVPTTGSDAFKDSYLEYCTLYVPEGSVEKYQATEPWSGFGKIVVKICESPVIKFVNGKITCSSATPHALCHYLYNVTNSSGSGYNGADVTMKMEISAYATAEGYANSDTVTETFDLNACSGLRGDVNGDGKVTIADANEVVNIFLGK